MRGLALGSGLVFLASFMASVGLSTMPGAVAAELSRPGRLARGLTLALVLVPLATLLVVRGLDVSRAIAVGLVLIATCPGVPLGSLAAKRAGGSASFTLVLLLVLGVVTAFTAAPSARWLLRHEGTVNVRPPLLIARLALVQWLPLAAGQLLRRRSPAQAAAGTRIARWLTVVSGVIFVVAAIGPFLPELGIIGWRGLAAILATMGISVGLGWLIGGHDQEMSRSLAVTAGVPNVGLAAAIARAANAPRILLTAIAAIFVVRVLANLILVLLLGHAQQRPTSSHPADPQHGSRGERGRGMGASAPAG